MEFDKFYRSNCFLFRHLQDISSLSVIDSYKKLIDFFGKGNRVVKVNIKENRSTGQTEEMINPNME